MLNQMIRGGRLDRSFYTSLLFDEYATGNAVGIVVLIFSVPALLSTLNVVFTAQVALYSLIRAGLSAIAAWAVATQILRRDGRIPTTFRLTGFAHVAFFPTVIVPWFSSLELPLYLASAVWYFLAMRVVAAVQFDLDDQGTMQVAGGALLGWLLAILFFGL